MLLCLCQVVPLRHVCHLAPRGSFGISGLRHEVGSDVGVARRRASSTEGSGRHRYQDRGVASGPRFRRDQRAPSDAPRLLRDQRASAIRAPSDAPRLLWDQRASTSNEEAQYAEKQAEEFDRLVIGDTAEARSITEVGSLLQAPPVAQAEAEHEEPSEDESGPDFDRDELEEPSSERCRRTLAGVALDVGLDAALRAPVARRRRRGRQRSQASPQLAVAAKVLQR